MAIVLNQLPIVARVCLGRYGTGAEWVDRLFGDGFTFDKHFRRIMKEVAFPGKQEIVELTHLSGLDFGLAGETTSSGHRPPLKSAIAESALRSGLSFCTLEACFELMLLDNEFFYPDRYFNVITKNIWGGEGLTSVSLSKMGPKSKPRLGHHLIDERSHIHSGHSNIFIVPNYR